MTKPKLLLVGAGAMGGALLRGWNQAGEVFDVSIVDPGQPNFFGNISELSPKYSPDIILFAIKPQLIVEIIPNYSRFSGKNCLFLSIMAGIGTDVLHGILGQDESIVRVMPNLPATVGQGMAALFSSRELSSSQRTMAELVFQSSGQILWVESEPLLNVVTAISGSGPAYFFRLVECLAAAGIEAGLTPDQAMRLARQTAVGSGAMLARAPESATELRVKVTSPGGTTAAALAAFDKDDRLQILVKEAVKAASDRALELGRATAHG
jgi:pyrroline-5-carboxylate reductase